jgi:superfamily II DNA or RNA helicase
MTAHLRCAALADVLATIAARMLDGDGRVTERLGGITLRPHQRHAADRLYDLIVAEGGALLADRVGLGKTFTALAVAAALHEHPLIVAPASLRDMWRGASARAGIDATVVSHEALSRGAEVSRHELVIIDEAHRVRSPGTRRYASIAALCARARVLLLSATPIQNRQSDLAAELALFLGRRAWEATADDLARHVVRGDFAPSSVPRLSGPHPISVATPDECIDQLLNLPPPVPARDESVAAALLTYGLLHQWTSSRAALVAALERRQARGAALDSAIESGRRPSRAELAAWTHAGDSLQLAFPELIVSGAVESDPELDALRRTIATHRAAVTGLLHTLARSPNPDRERAEVLRRIRAAHPGERVIAFCHYAETVNALRAAMRHDAGVAALTAAGAHVASGRIPRNDVIGQFTPDSMEARSASRVDRIDLLLTTDLLSEGLNLQEASVVVHLDLPWNPARLDQRVGRVRRLGSRHEIVTVYTVLPPISIERLLRIEERLRTKLSVAQRTIGVAGRILPSSRPEPDADRGMAERQDAIRDHLRRWRTTSAIMAPDRADETLVTGCSMPHAGYLAAVSSSGAIRLVVDLGDGPRTAAADIARALALIDNRAGASSDLFSVDVRRIVEHLDAWLANQSGTAAIDLAAAAAARSRRKALARVAQTLARAPRYRRAALAPLADAARAIGTAALGEGAERVLDTLVAAPLGDEAWLRSIAAFSELNMRSTARPTGESRVIALVVFQPDA